MVLLTVNSLIKVQDSSACTIERVLWLDESYSNAVVIDIYSHTSIPAFKRVADITELIQLGQARILDEDPLHRVIVEDELGKKALQIRDKAWEIVSTIAGRDQEPLIYYPKKRAELILNACEQFGIAKKTIYLYLRKYWQRGKHKNALVPDYNNCGRGERSVSNKKLGRPRKYQTVVGVGINVDEETKRVFRVALNRFYFNQNEVSLRKTYELMRREYYSDEVLEEQGRIQRVLRPSLSTPTFGQFKYWFYKERDFRREISARKGLKNYLQNHRPIIGDATFGNAIGPGSQYAIDASIADIFLCSRYNRSWIIGRPIIYTVVDNFSRMVVGIYVGLEGPSWLGAMMALSNATQNKVEFCKQYEIDIAETGWPAHHLCETLICDRGELQGKMPETLIGTLQVNVQNTAPYRADMKPYVERMFGRINEYIKPHLPGVVRPDFRERGSRDYRLDAMLDIYQFTQIMIKVVLQHNREWLKDYRRDELMIADELEPTPMQIWNWGIQNRAGKLRSVSEDIVKLSLMPSSKAASITPYGIRFRGMVYSSHQSLQERWFEKARNSGGWKIEVTYDPRNLNYIYIRKEDGRSYEKCSLLEHQDRYRDRTIEEIEHLLEQERLNQIANEDGVLQSKSDLISDIEGIVLQAKEMSKQSHRVGESNRQKIKGIRLNRSVEKLVNRKQEAFELGKAEQTTKAQVVPLNKNDDSESDSEILNELELLRRKQREKRDGKHE